MRLVDDIFPEIDEHALVQRILERLCPLVGSGATFKQIIGRLDDLEWQPDAINQALAFLAESGHVTWSDRQAAAGHTYRLFRFTRPWPEHLAWDGVWRAAPGRAGRVPAPNAR